MFMPSSVGMVRPSAPLDPVDESVFYPVDPAVGIVLSSDYAPDGMNLGLLFTVNVAGGVVNALCYYRLSDTQSASGRIALWEVAHDTDVLLFETTYSGHSGTGWRAIALDEPIPVRSSSAYVVHLWIPPVSGDNTALPVTPNYFPNRGRYSVPWGFTYASISNGQSDIRGFLRRNGLIQNGAFTRPADHYNASNYWVDAVVNARPTLIPPDPPLTLKWPIPEGYPNNENTGVDPDTVFTVELESINSTADGQIIEDMDLRAGIAIGHNNVTLRNCKVRGQAGHIVYIYPDTTGTLVEDCSIDGVGRRNNGTNGVTLGGTDVTLRRLNIYRVENGLSFFTHEVPSNALIEDCFIHNMRAGPGGIAHYDGSQMDGGQSNVTFRHNTIFNENGDTSCLMIDNLGGPITNVLIEDNYLAGAGYTCYVDERFHIDGSFPITDVRYYNNLLRIGIYGYFAIAMIDSPLPVRAGNQYLTHGGLFDDPPVGGFTEGQLVPESFGGAAQSVPGTVIGETVTPEVGGLTLGISFTPLVDGDIVGVNFVRPQASSTIHHEVGIWRYTGDDADAGIELLMTQVFPNEIHSGPTFLDFDAPLAVVAGERYLVGVFIPRGSDGKVWYIHNAGRFWPDPVPSQWGRMMAFSNNPATPYGGFNGRNGTFLYGSTLQAPLTYTGSDTNFYVDPLFVAPWE